ncbi:MAG: hypothetical protein COB67_05980 [SAR324 cluster bacterium]|uniref:YggT family protein n=1 Tax=SAR324 cluster bacterium TaxID=2024889 RepID=A0A2A4T4Y9_9DELT|nr:MAG: hypothetical protein COB67_05980 [SAR324 cluster bacterium]
MQELIIALFDVADALLTVLIWAVIIRALLSWIRPDPHHILVRLLMRVTDPILMPISRLMPNLGGIDITPILAIFLIQGIQRVVLGQLLNAFLGTAGGY